MDQLIFWLIFVSCGVTGISLYYSDCKFFDKPYKELKQKISESDAWYAERLRRAKNDRIWEIEVVRDMTQEERNELKNSYKSKINARHEKMENDE